MKSAAVLPLDEIERLAQDRSRARANVLETSTAVEAAERRLAELRGQYERARAALDVAEAALRVQAARLVRGDA